jgi:hypothetical protein
MLPPFLIHVFTNLSAAVTMKETHHQQSGGRQYG